MTTNLFNTDIGDLGSAAATVAPVADQSELMRAQAGVREKQANAQAFNNLAQGIYSIAPVVKEIAAQKFVEKNVVGTDGVADVNQATKEEKVMQDAFRNLDRVVESQKNVYVEDIKTLQGLEQARLQGAITWEEMQLRAATIRAAAIDRAPLFTDHINAAFRSVTGTSTGTGAINASLAVSPWSMTPEEEAFHEERKINAAYAAEYNVGLTEADHMRAQDAWGERNRVLKPENDAQFALFTQGEILKSRLEFNKVMIKFANEDGVIDPEAGVQLVKEIDAWEMQTLADLQQHAHNLSERGVALSVDRITAMQEDVQKQAQQFRDMMDDTDAVKFAQDMVKLSTAKTQQFVYDNLPNLAVAKEAGVDLVKLGELAITSGDHFWAYAQQNPAFAQMTTLLAMTPDEIALTGASQAINTALGDTSPTPEEASVTMDMANSSPEIASALWSLADTSGTTGNLNDAITLNPQAVVQFKDSELWETVPSTETRQNAFQAAADGIEGYLFKNKEGNAPLDFSVWVDDGGKVGAEGNGVDNQALGMLQDLYDTAIANGDVIGDQDASMYLQSLFPNRRHTITGETSEAVKGLQTLSSKEAIDSIETNMNSYVSTIEDVEAVSSVLDKQLRTLPVGVAGNAERTRVIMLQNELWEKWEGVHESGGTAPADDLADVSNFVNSLTDVLSEEQINDKLSTAGYQFKDGKVSRL